VTANLYDGTQPLLVGIAAGTSRRNGSATMQSQPPGIGRRGPVAYNWAMPLFEYECRDCGKPFEAFVTADRAAACPACEGTNLTKLLSRLGMVGVAAAPRGEGCATPAAPMCGGGRCGCAN
jgi:putative FmdB family regulatory protein